MLWLFNFNVMNKQIYKGVEVISAKEIHEALGIKKRFSAWFTNNAERALLTEGKDYFFKRTDNQIYVPKGTTYNEDYLLTEHSAITIIVMSGGQNAKKLRDHVIQLFQKHESGDAFTTDQISALLDLTKAMTLTSIRKESERKHFDFFNKPNEWWTYRAKLLGYSKETMQKEMAKINKIYKNNEQALSLLEPSELIRTGTVDLLIALGKSREYSLNVAKLTKRFAVEMGIDKEIWNDVKENPLKLNQKEVEEKKGFFSNVRKMLGV